jgi:hypothetical protein
MPDSDLAVLPQSSPDIVKRPILEQVWRDLTEFSKAQGIPAIFMGFGTFVAAIMLGQITSLWSGFWLLVLSILAGLVFYALIAVVRAPFIVIGQHHRQLSDINQRLMNAESRLTEAYAVKQLPAPIKAEPKEPNIVYLSAEIVEAHRQHHGGIYEGRGPFINRRQEWFWACVVSFRNEVLKNREIGGRGQVSAKISYVFQQEGGSKTASRAAWFATDRFHVTFGINDTQTLVVATFEDWQLFAIQENPSSGFSDDRTKKLPLLGDVHQIHIELISESESKVLCSAELILKITRKPELNIKLLPV